jgi:hypothetical protein
VTISPAGTLTLGTAGATTTVLGNVSATTSNQTITLSPTGTGTVAISPVGALTINPTAASTMNNTSVGATTRSTGAFTFVGAGQASTATAYVTTAAGTATIAPIDLTPGTNLTAAAAGAIEYDGGVFYSTPTANCRGVALSEQYIVLSSTNTLTSQTGVQPLFDGGGGPANGLVTLPVGLYEFECQFALSAMSATSGSFGFALGGGATFTQAWSSMALDGTLATAANPQVTYNTAANTTLCTASVATTGFAKITGIIRITVAGTLIPQVSQTTAAAAVVAVNSFFRIRCLSGTSTTVTVGNWS